ncbi:LysR family transcriptional regulator [Aquincola sp. S2]|uniref:LysR family transcriptional regulator n=1 Tax=Pseudaquabacterium terrae TaxID=2732868 RepID=A0ABX2EEK9_9BURK|nr:LysR substrate-binding domain-containing protein [Aquabacterium terrae]NRF67042.1 LysR family transcriptional regulator [Aquabacterium terrae]
MLELRQLRYFVAVAQAEHVGRAAERLAISQPPLSRQIQDLEQRLGLALFTRAQRRLKLTPAGRDFLAQAQALLAHAAQVEQDALRAAQGTEGRLTLGTVEGALHAGLVQADMLRFGSEAPKVVIDLRGLRSAGIFDGLRRGELDAGYAYSAPADDDPLLASALRFSEPLVLALPASHPLAGRRRAALRPAQLDGQVFITMPAATHAAARSEWLAGCQAGGFTPDVRYEAAEPAAVLSLVGAGLGLAIVQHSSERIAPPGVVFRALPWLPMALRIFLVWRREAASAAGRLFVELAGAGTSASARP